MNLYHSPSSSPTPNDYDDSLYKLKTNEGKREINETTEYSKYSSKFYLMKLLLFQMVI